jgi:hypothetical protein
MPFATAEARAAWSRDYYRRNRQAVLAYKKRWNDSNPEKRRAEVAVGNAIRDGRLTRQPCEDCGSDERVEAHHDDYSKPLDVTWLCSTCHGKTRRKVA